MSGANKIRWSIWKVPVGPESKIVKKRIFQDLEKEVLVQFQKLREDGSTNYSDGLVVTDQHGDQVFACS